jgi:hypothetical protein
MTNFKIYDLKEIWRMSSTNNKAKTIQIVENFALKSYSNRHYSLKKYILYSGINYHLK